MRRVALLFLTLTALACKDRQGAAPIGPEAAMVPVLEAGRLEAYSEAFYEIIPRGARLEILAEGHDWTEGPLWVAQGGYLLYSDIPRNAVYKWAPAEGSQVYLQPSGFSGTDFKGEEPGSNGLLLDPEGRLVLCQHGNRQVARMRAALDNPAPEFETLAASYQGKRLNSPNDAVYDRQGNLYFTDPPYGLPGQMQDPGKELDFQGVYRLSREGELTLLTRELSRPNGLALSPDEQRLYVANSDPEAAYWVVFDRLPDGTLGPGERLFDATDRTASEKGLPDGMKVHDKGYVFGTGPGGIYVFAPDGALLGRILTGEATSNCAFNEEQTALFITADAYVLKLDLLPLN
jgi:gluconolactonase